MNNKLPFLKMNNKLPFLNWSDIERRLLLLLLKMNEASKNKAIWIDDSTND